MFASLGLLAVLLPAQVQEPPLIVEGGPEPVVAVPGPPPVLVDGDCGRCGCEIAELHRLIARLQCCPRWKDRKRAAHELRDFSWKCHPEAPLALVAALQRDSEEEVREEAAQSLKAMKPCLPEVHETLAYAARHDPDWATRLWARWALKSLGKRCVGSCNACGTVPVAAPAWPAGPPIRGVRLEPAPVAEPGLILSEPATRLAPLDVAPPIEGAPVPIEPPLDAPAAVDPPLPPDVSELPPLELPADDTGRSPFTRPSASRRDSTPTRERDLDLERERARARARELERDREREREQELERSKFTERRGLGLRRFISQVIPGRD